MATSPATASASPVATGTVLATLATPPPNQVLGNDASPRRNGQVLPAAGAGFIDRHLGAGRAGFVLLAVAIGFVGVAMGVGRRLA